MRRLPLKSAILVISLLFMSLTALAAVPAELALTPTPTPAQPADRPVTLLQPGRIYEGNYFGAPVAFQFDAELGQFFMFGVTTDDFDAVLEIADPAGTQVARDDDGGPGNMPHLVFIAPSTGRFTATVRAFSEPAEGAYILQMTSAVRTLEHDVPVVTEVDGVSSALYGFEAAAGDIVNIVASSGDTIDTTLRLFAPDGREVAYIDDFSGIDPELRRLQLGQDGRYYVLHAPYSSSAVGEVTLLVERTEHVILNADLTTAVFDDYRGRDVFMMNVEAGKLYVVTVTSPGSFSGSIEVQFTDDPTAASDTSIVTAVSSNVVDVAGTSLFFRAEQDGPHRLAFSVNRNDSSPLTLYISVRGLAE